MNNANQMHPQNVGDDVKLGHLNDSYTKMEMAQSESACSVQNDVS